MTAPQSDIDQTLRGRVIAVPETRQLDVLASLLEKRGASVVRCPLVAINDAPDEHAVVAWIRRRIDSPTDLVIFYTGEGVDRLVGFAERAGLRNDFTAALRRTPKLTRGPKPKRALHRLGLEAELEAVEPTTEGMIATLSGMDLAGKRVALQLYSQDQDQELADYLRGHGAEPDCVAPYVYASKAEDEQVVRLIGELEAGRIDAIAFTSQAQIHRLLKLAHSRGLDAVLRAGLKRTHLAAVGPVVAAELENAGFHVAAMPDDNFSMKPLVTALSTLLAPH